MFVRHQQLRLFLTGNHRRLDDIVFITNPSSVCNITIVGFKFGQQNYCHNGPALGIKFWSSIGFHCFIPLVRIAGKRNSQRNISHPWSSLIYSAFHQQYSNDIMHDHTWHVMFKNSTLPIRLNCFVRLLVFPIYREMKTCGPWLQNVWCGIQNKIIYKNNFGNMWNLNGLLYLKETSKTSYILCRGMWQLL